METRQPVFPDVKLARGVVLMLTTDVKVDRRILLEADSLEAVGWSVTIISMPSAQSGEADDHRIVRLGGDPEAGFSGKNTLSAYQWFKSCFKTNNHYLRWIKRFAWRYLVDKSQFFSKLYFPTAVKFNAKVVVAHDLPMLPVARKLASKFGAKLVYDSHELYCEQEMPKWESKRWKAVEKRFIGLCDAIVTVNQSIASELERRYRVSPVHVISNAERKRAIQSPLARKIFHECFGLSSGQKILLLQGGLSPGRNLETLLCAMQYVKNESIVLVFLGDGPILMKLKSITNQLRLSEKVFFHPEVPQGELHNYTVAADIGVIPYQATCLNNYYSTPNKLFEFIACGLPVLASDLPEISQLVKGGNIGMVSDLSTSENIAQKIDEVFSDQSRIDVWGSNLNILRETVCWEREANKLTGIFDALNI